MLDDVAQIAEIDTQNALAVAAAQPQQLMYDDLDIKFARGDFNNIVLTGMGGSALAGLICRNWWDSQLKIPFVITRNYDLPAFVGPETLVIASSYSGNTEENLSAATAAHSRGAEVLAITSGGKLGAWATEQKINLIKLPTNYQPRMAVWFSVRILADIFEKLSLVKNAIAQLSTAHRFLTHAAEKYAAQITTANNPAKQLAVQLGDFTPVVYAGPALAAAAYKWKINFNENAKMPAFYNEFPELNHNEFVGWAGSVKNFAVIELISSLDDKRISKRFEVTNRLLKGKINSPIKVMAEGSNQIEQLLWTIMLGDFTSIYSGLLNGVDPTPVKMVEDLKQQLA